MPTRRATSLLAPALIFASLAAPRTAAAEEAAASASASTSFSPSRGGDARATVLPWVLGGLGVAQLATGAVLLAAAPDTPANCDTSTRTCIRRPGQSDASLRDDQEEAGRADQMPTFGAIALVSGATFLVTGIATYLWYRPGGPGARSAAVVPYATASGGGLAAFARF